MEKRSKFDCVNNKELICIPNPCFFVVYLAKLPQEAGIDKTVLLKLSSNVCLFKLL